MKENVSHSRPATRRPTSLPSVRIRICSLVSLNVISGRIVINRRILAAALGLALVGFLTPRLGLAAENHLAEAITHTKQAIEHGKMGHADVLVTHAEAALTHAEAAEKAKANPHTKQGITHLEAAIGEGKKSDAEAATKHAEEALTHLEAAEN